MRPSIKRLRRKRIARASVREEAAREHLRNAIAGSPTDFLELRRSYLHLLPYSEVNLIELGYIDIELCKRKEEKEEKVDWKRCGF